MKANNENDMLGTNGNSTVQSLEKIPALLRERRWVETSRDARLFIVFFLFVVGNYGDVVVDCKQVCVKSPLRLIPQAPPSGLYSAYSLTSR